MIRRKLILLVLLAGLVSGPVILAAPDGGLAITWWTMDGGGGRSSGGPYVLTGTAGQPDVYSSASSGYDCNSYFLAAGFWTPPTAAIVTMVCELFLPVVVK